MVAICPAVNLIQNVGDGEEATHTNDMDIFLKRQVSSILPLTYPYDVRLDRKYDELLMRNWVNTFDYGWSGIKRFPYLLNRYIKRIVGYQGSWLNTKCK